MSQKSRIHDRASSIVEAANEFGSYARFFERLRKQQNSEAKKKEMAKEKDLDDFLMNPNCGLFKDVLDDEEDKIDAKKNKYAIKYRTGEVVSSNGLSKLSKEEIDQTKLFPDPDLEKLRLKEKKKR